MGGRTAYATDCKSVLSRFDSYPMDLTKYIKVIYCVYMNTASILIKTDPQVKANAQKTAEKMGLSLTSVINRYLRHFITVETITFSVKDETPNQYLINALKESEEDVKAGRVISFDNPKKALDYLDREIADERRKRSSH